MCQWYIGGEEMKYHKLLLTDKQLQVLQGMGIENTLWSYVTDEKDYYDITAVKQLIYKIRRIK